MTAALDKLAGDIVGAIFDDYEDEKIVSRSRWEEIVKKIIQSHVDKLTPSYGGFGVGAFTLVDTLYDVRLPAGTLKPLGDGVHVYREFQPITETVVRIALNEKSRKWSDVDPPLLPVTVEICGQPGVTCTVTPDRLVMRAADGTILMEHGFDDLGNPCPIKPVDPPLLPDED